VRKLFVCIAVGLLLGGCSSPSPQPPPPIPTITTQSTASEPPSLPDRPATTTTVEPPPIAQTDSVCEGAEDWTTDLKQNKASSGAKLYKVRFAAHPTCDRVVFVIDGPAAAGYHVGYVPQLTYDGSGDPLYVEGQAVLQVVIRAGLKGVDPSGPLAFQTGEWLLQGGQGKGYKALTAIRFANFYEGHSTVGIGVATKGLRFRVQVFPGENGGDARVIIDIAHAS
jgi:hypothetical protein